jgi:diguanylate cyclase (GGDEF)-like protein/PAS domain S-box-containing protein
VTAGHGGGPWFRALVENSFDLITVMDPSGRFSYVSPSVERLCGYRSERFADLSWRGHDLVHPDDRDRADQAMATLLAFPAADVTLELRQRHGSGSWRWYEVKFRNLLGDPVVRGIVAQHRDITDQRDREDLLAHAATHDALTGLSNRPSFEDHLARALVVARLRSMRLAVLMVDLDHFKQVNDTLGHCFGDELLYEVGRRLVVELREAEAVARLGGDEFAVLLSTGADAESAQSAAHRLIRTLERPVVLSGRSIWVGASVGTAAFPEDGTEPQILLHRADLAMYEAKRHSLGPVAYHADLEGARELNPAPNRAPLLSPPEQKRADVEPLV